MIENRQTVPNRSCTFTWSGGTVWWLYSKFLSIKYSFQLLHYPWPTFQVRPPLKIVLKKGTRRISGPMHTKLSFILNKQQLFCSVNSKGYMFTHTRKNDILKKFKSEERFQKVTFRWRFHLIYLPEGQSLK